MRSILLATWLVVPFSIFSSEPSIISLTGSIAQSHHLAASDFETFNLIASCRYHRTNCHNPLVFEQIEAIIQPEFNPHTAPPLQKAVFELLQPIVVEYNQAISTFANSSLSPIQRTLLLDLAKCLFFKLDCSIKADFLLPKTSANFDTLKSALSFKTDLDNAYTSALEKSLVMGVPPIQSLESYQDTDFVKLSQKFALDYYEYWQEKNQDSKPTDISDLEIRLTAIKTDLAEQIDIYDDLIKQLHQTNWMNLPEIESSIDSKLKKIDQAFLKSRIKSTDNNAFGIL